MSEYAPNRTAQVFQYYANWDNDTIILAPTPNAAYTIELAYNALPTGYRQATRRLGSVQTYLNVALCLLSRSFQVFERTRQHAPDV